MKLQDIGRPLFFVARETTEAMKNDPALALRSTATVLQSMVFNGVEDSVKLSASQAAVPVIRTALLGTNLYQAAKTFQKPDATWIDKGMDVLRVTSDLVGVAGAAAMAFMPAYAQLGTKLVGAAYAADLVSHAYRGITHTEKRMRVWELELNQSNGTPQQPTPSQPPTPPAEPPK